MKSTLTALQQQSLLQQQHLNDDQHSELNLSDVIDVIRHSDPSTFAEFQSHLSLAMNNNTLPASASNAKAAAMAELNRQKKLAYVKILEQPASKGLRFRYECEGRSAGSIPGASSTNESKTYPTIQIVGYKGRAVVVVSCVTADAPYRPHPHNLVGKEGCKKGVCTLEIPQDSMKIAFQSLGIQCVKKKEIDEALNLRQQIRVDPFQTGFAHRDNTQSLDLNCVRLCFQVFLEGNEKGAFTYALKPVVSDPIFDKKAKNDLTICRMTEYSASAAGGKEMLLFCDKVIKDDIQVRFFEEDVCGKIVWEGLGDFQPSDVHKQYGIAFRTPRYKDIEIERPIQVKLQLRRPSDGAVSESRKFEFLPLDSGRGFWTAKRLKSNYNVFNSILSMDQEMHTEEQLRRKKPFSATDSRSSPSTSPSLSPTKSSQATATSSSMLVIPMPNPTLVEASSALPPLPPRTAISTTTAQRQRPHSAYSDVSNTDTIVTRQSVNEILSLADEDHGGRQSTLSMEIENTQELSFDSLMKMESGNHQNSDEDILKNQVAMGSLTSVATVRENKEDNKKNQTKDAMLTPKQEDIAQHLDSKAEHPPTLMDPEVSALYDDVMQCVYDDVDTKYDDVDFPPQPPIRMNKAQSEQSQEQEQKQQQQQQIREILDRPLPGTPTKLPTIIASMIGKHHLTNNNNKQKSSNGKVDPVSPRKKTSLFQRVFQRSKSQSELNQVNANNNDSEPDTKAPPVPLHQSLNDSCLDSLNGNNNPSTTGDEAVASPTEAELHDLQNFLDGANLDHLDNMVTEFAREYLPSNESSNDNNTILS